VEGKSGTMSAKMRYRMTHRQRLEEERFTRWEPQHDITSLPVLRMGIGLLVNYHPLRKGRLLRDLIEEGTKPPAHSHPGIR
jgi:hypothetical protein